MGDGGGGKRGEVYLSGGGCLVLTADGGGVNL